STQGTGGPDYGEQLGSSLESEPQNSTTSPGAPTTSKHASPRLSKLILKAVATSEKRSGLSLQALKKIIVATGYNMAKKKTHFKRVLLSLVTKGLLQKLRGTGASGSFGIGKEMAKKMGKRESSAQEGGLPKTGSRKPGRKRKAANTRAVKPQRRRTFEAHHLPALMT
uniref:H15 domain-containing protein n=1 Tax=Chelydra serpentina TaxID=8475 RepID=A0A8C3TFZ2_CHESE